MTRQTESDVSEVRDNGMQVMKIILSTHKRIAITYVLPAVFYKEYYFQDFWLLNLDLSL